MRCGEGPTFTETSIEPCDGTCHTTESPTNSTGSPSNEKENNNVILSLAGGSIAVIVFLFVGLAGFKLYKAKFSRRRNFNYTLSAEDNGNIVGDENRINC